MAVSFRANATVKMQIRQLQTVGSTRPGRLPSRVVGLSSHFLNNREMWEAQWLPYRASLFSPELPSVQCWQAGEFTKAGRLRLGDDHTTSTGHSLSLHRDLVRVIKVLPQRSTVRCKNEVSVLKTYQEANSVPSNIHKNLSRQESWLSLPDRYFHEVRAVFSG